MSTFRRTSAEYRKWLTDEGLGLNDRIPFDTPPVNRNFSQLTGVGLESRDLSALDLEGGQYLSLSMVAYTQELRRSRVPEGSTTCANKFENLFEFQKEYFSGAPFSLGLQSSCPSMVEAYMPEYLGSIFYEKDNVWRYFYWIDDDMYQAIRATAGYRVEVIFNDTVPESTGDHILETCFNLDLSGFYFSGFGIEGALLRQPINDISIGDIKKLLTSEKAMEAGAATVSALFVVGLIWWVVTRFDKNRGPKPA